MTSASVQSHNAPALEALLKAEKLTGTTERDPTQKRHDYVYFEKSSYFVLVEDLKQELATITAIQYPGKSRDGKEKTLYPVLFNDPRSRGPFVPYDEREERKREKQEQAEKDRHDDQQKRKQRLLEYSREKRKQAEAEAEAQRHNELRRSQSLTNLRRRATYNGRGTNASLADLDGEYGGEHDIPESAAASGYLASHAYTAASGNSVSITSATGTTSTSGLPLRHSAALPRGLLDRLAHEVVTSTRVSSQPPRSRKDSISTNMGPPPLPDKQRMLRKCRSTNTMRLPKRDEASKPGYCESCRQKFQDFNEVRVHERR